MLNAIVILNQSQRLNSCLAQVWTSNRGPNLVYLRIIIQNDKTALNNQSWPTVRKGFVCFCNTLECTRQQQLNVSCKLDAIASFTYMDTVVMMVYNRISDG